MIKMLWVTHSFWTEAAQQNWCIPEDNNCNAKFEISFSDTVTISESAKNEKKH